MHCCAEGLALHCLSSLWKWDHQKSNAYLCLTFGWEWSGHGQTSRTGSGAYGKLWWNPNHTSHPMLRRYGSPSREAGYDWPVYLEERDTICSSITDKWGHMVYLGQTNLACYLTLRQLWETKVNCMYIPLKCSSAANCQVSLPQFSHSLLTFHFLAVYKIAMYQHKLFLA